MSDYAVKANRIRKGLDSFQFGGPDRGRTDDLVNAIHALSQLSYGPAFDYNCSIATRVA